MKKECNHKFVPLRQEPSHEGACYHVGNCLIDILYCEKCGEKKGHDTFTSISTNSTNA